MLLQQESTPLTTTVVPFIENMPSQQCKKIRFSTLIWIWIVDRMCVCNCQKLWLWDCKTNLYNCTIILGVLLLRIREFKTMTMLICSPFFYHSVWSDSISLLSVTFIFFVYIITILFSLLVGYDEQWLCNFFLFKQHVIMQTKMTSEISIFFNYWTGIKSDPLEKSLETFFCFVIIMPENPIYSPGLVAESGLLEEMLSFSLEFVACNDKVKECGVAFIGGMLPTSPAELAPAPV